MAQGLGRNLRRELEETQALIKLAGPTPSCGVRSRGRTAAGLSWEFLAILGSACGGAGPSLAIAPAPCKETERAGLLEKGTGLPLVLVSQGVRVDRGPAWTLDLPVRSPCSKSWPPCQGPEQQLLPRPSPSPTPEFHWLSSSCAKFEIITLKTLRSR